MASENDTQQVREFLTHEEKRERYLCSHKAAAKRKLNNLAPIQFLRSAVAVFVRWFETERGVSSTYRAAGGDDQITRE